MGDKFLSIDLGSNTLRAAIFMEKDGEIYKDKSVEFIVGSAKGLAKTNQICNEAVGKIKQALNDVLKQFGLVRFSDIAYAAVATEAFRKALNSSEVFDEIYSQNGIKFNIISPTAEGRFSFLGIQEASKKIGTNSDNLAFIDLGGASTEIGDAQASKSFELGIVTFYERCDKNLMNVLRQANEATKKLKEYLLSLDKSTIALTSGISTTVAALRLGYTWQSYDAEAVNGYVLSVDDFGELGAEVLAMSDEEAKIRLGADRKMLVLTGLSLLEAMLKGINTKLIVIDDGLREGVAAAYFRGELENLINLKEQK
ncbi:disulfide bond formation protein DsbA [Campylobacter sp. 19-13652]|uniref:Ppx/GppA phosphatase family protein n=1 Tax=Campylobacter sp. 19-13652 TaxID=2840180 RepID=UPI001C76BEF3|nr:disulfide bond formation protein DsbA [Campylobacter sp. 19-13652]BCX79489.1 phosphatase [Campylobacter sp. 19-13652]